MHSSLPTADPVNEQVYIRENNKGRGVYARKSFEPGERILVGKRVAVLPERNWLTVQMDLDLHVRLDEPFELLNHSCDPNGGVRPNAYGGYDLVALRHIAADEELNFDYAMTEWNIVGMPECRCGSPLCRKQITGGEFLPPERLEKYRGFLAPFYEKLLGRPL